MNRRPVIAWVLGAIAALELIAVIVGTMMAPGDQLDVVASYAVTNVAFGVSFGACGLLIATRKPASPIGWLFLIGGVGHLTTAATAPWGIYGVDRHWPEFVTRSLASAYLFAWPAGILFCFPLAFLLFPTGKLLSPRWRAVVVAQAIVWLGMVVNGELDPNSAGDTRAGRSLFAWAGFGSLDPMWTVLTVLAMPAALATMASLGVRYRRGDDVVRRQLLWLMLALVAALALNVQRFATGYGPILLLLAFELVPLAVTVAILRYQLLDIRLVVSRAMLYLVLSLAVVGVYVGLIALADAVLRRRVGGVAVFAALVIALLFNPARLWLQGVVDRLFYGSRRDPVRALSAVGEQLTGDSQDHVLVLDAIREELRLPYAAIRTDGDEVTSGVEPVITHAVELRYTGRTIGELVVGMRYGQNHLSASDVRVLAMVAAPLAAAVHANALAEQVRQSRERLVLAREEERRRIRRDLHDGLGPALTGVAFTIDAVGNVLASDPERANVMLAQLRAETTAAISEIRRLVYGLRPPSLDELGLLGALRAQAARLDHRADGSSVEVVIEAPPTMPELPAAVEVAAYRIVVEALTNVARHSAAGRAQVSIGVGAGLDLEVLDNGGSNGHWRPGVGLASMAERAAEVGGTCEAGPTPTGGRVRAQLPLPVLAG